MCSQLSIFLVSPAKPPLSVKKRSDTRDPLSDLGGDSRRIGGVVGWTLGGSKKGQKTPKNGVFGGVKIGVKKPEKNTFFGLF